MKGDRMKKSTKTLLVVSTFAVAMNLNACVYGPPVEMSSDPTTVIDSSEGEIEPSNTEDTGD
jgi:hypothetical protein